MRIIIATFSFPDLANGHYDGRFVLAEARGYALNGAQVLVITPHYPGAAVAETLPDGIRVQRFRYFWPPRWQRLKVPGQPIYRIRSALALLQVPVLLGAFALALLRAAGQADLIHAQWTLTALLALPAKWLRGVKLVVTARGSDLRLLPAWMNRWLHRQVDAAIDCFGPQPWNRAYKAANPARYLTLPLLVDPGDPNVVAPELAAVRAQPHPPLTVLYIGRVDRIKLNVNRLPLLDLIEAAALLKARGVNVRVFYLGDGEREIIEQMRTTIARLDVGDRVALLGPRVDVAPYVRGCDLGVGGIALNGVAMDFTVVGRPQVLIDTDENLSTPWRHRETALMVPPEDAVALAAVIEWAEQSRETLRVIGTRARAEMSDLVTSSEHGGKDYLRAFASV